MTSVKSAKLQLQSDSLQTFKKDQNDTLVDESESQSHGDSSDEENQRIVDILFPKKKLRRPRQDEDIFYEQDNDIKAFLEEQVPGLYKKDTTDEIYEDSEEEKIEEIQYQNDADYLNYSTVSGPAYFTMSKFQKVSYFQHLNAIYMARMRPQKQTKNAIQHFNNENVEKKQLEGKQNGVKEQKQKPLNKKCAIRFNQIVFEVPFNKEEEPIMVKDTPQQEAFIMFDDEAYDELIHEMEFERDEEDEEKYAKEYLEMKGKNDLRRTQLYINEQEDSSSDEAERLYRLDRRQFMKEFEEIQRHNGQILEDSDDQNMMYSGSDSDEDIWGYEYGFEDSSEEDQAEYQNLADMRKHYQKETEKIMGSTIRQIEQKEKDRKNWKRNMKGQFVEDQEESSDDNDDSSDSSDGSSSESENTQKKNLQKLQNSRKESNLSKENQQQTSLIEEINGRKINPNLTKKQQNRQIEQNQQKGNQDTPENETSSPIITENIQNSESLKNSLEQQICQNTSEGKPIE